MKISNILLSFLVTLALALPLTAQAKNLGKGDPDDDAPLAALNRADQPMPSDNITTPAKAKLGELLYFDPRMGGDASLSCATCHNPKQGWAFGDPICRGYPGTVHWRNCQTVVNTGFYKKIFWAGSTTSLEAQVFSAANGGVAGNGERDVEEARLIMIPGYVKRFKEVFGTPWPKVQDFAKAIAAFERTLVDDQSPFDNYMRGDKKALPASAKRGMKLFQGKANCIECHNGAFFTDEKYYNIGVPRAVEFEEKGLNQISFRFEVYAKGATEGMYRHIKDDPGAYGRGKVKSMKGKFRTPTLRYLTPTPPYMHNGTFFTLEEVVDFYNDGGGENDFTKSEGNKTKILKKLNLSDKEKGDLVAFLEALTGPEVRPDLIKSAPKLPEYAPLPNTEHTILPPDSKRPFYHHPNGQRASIGFTVMASSMNPCNPCAGK
ncbi:MAG: cytochrome c peroxidase [Mariprofundaceae bacterium]